MICVGKSAIHGCRIQMRSIINVNTPLRRDVIADKVCTQIMRIIPGIQF
jgi:carbonic anhydrase/acetyltransferase-like protein (isoleucine patch superfamily)